MLDGERPLDLLRKPVLDPVVAAARAFGARRGVSGHPEAVFRSGPYRFFFFSNEGFEPVHVHVEGSEGYAKLWVEPLTLAEARGLNSKQLSHIRQLVREHRNEIVEAWHAHFGHQE